MSGRGAGTKRRRASAKTTAAETAASPPAVGEGYVILLIRCLLVHGTVLTLPGFYCPNTHTQTQYRPEAARGSNDDDDDYDDRRHRWCDDELCLDDLSNTRGIVIHTRIVRGDLPSLG